MIRSSVVPYEARAEWADVGTRGATSRERLSSLVSCFTTSILNLSRVPHHPRTCIKQRLFPCSRQTTQKSPVKKIGAEAAEMQALEQIK